MADPLVPAAGVRVLLDREAVDEGGGARYRGALIGPGARLDFAVAFDAAGEVSLAPLAASDLPVEAADARAVALLRAIARTVGRHAIASAPPAWPRRIVRWRPLP